MLRTKIDLVKFIWGTIFILLAVWLMGFIFVPEAMGDNIPFEWSTNTPLVQVTRTDKCGKTTTTGCWFDTGTVGPLVVSWQEASCSSYTPGLNAAQGLGRDSFGATQASVTFGNTTLTAHPAKAWKALSPGTCLIGLDIFPESIITLDTWERRILTYNWPAEYYHAHYISARIGYMQLWNSFIGPFPGFSYSSPNLEQLMDFRRSSYWDYTYIPVGWVDACGRSNYEWCVMDSAINSFAITHSQMSACNQYPAPNPNVVGQAINFPQVIIGSKVLYNHPGNAYRSFTHCAIAPSLFWQRFFTVDKSNGYVATYNDPGAFWYRQWDAAKAGVCLIWSIFVGPCPW